MTLSVDAQTEELALHLDHVNLSVADLARAKAFYLQCLEPLGLVVVGEYSAEQTGSADCVGFGVGRKGSLWLSEKGAQTPATHICFRTKSRAKVDAFYAAAIAAGATDNGPPGSRPIYHDAYYAAFVLSPEGHNIEAVTFAP